MVQFRKRKKIGPFRVTLSQRGISTSVGTGAFRISKGADGKVRWTIRIPGTGIYDTKFVNRRRPRPARKRVSGRHRVMPPDQHQPARLPPAGWYPDPVDAAFPRYWDGHEWTSTSTRPSLDVQPPVPTVDAITPEDEPAFGTAAAAASGLSGQQYRNPIAGRGVDLDAPDRRDPVTGKPLSDKKAATAAVLQLFFGIFGAGRFYIGSKVIGGCQLGLTIVSFVLAQVTASSDTASGLVGLLMIGVIIWAITDAIRMFITRSVTDGQGRKLR